MTQSACLCRALLGRGLPALFATRTCAKRRGEWRHRLSGQSNDDPLKASLGVAGQRLLRSERDMPYVARRLRMNFPNLFFKFGKGFFDRIPDDI